LKAAPEHGLTGGYTMSNDDRTLNNENGKKSSPWILALVALIIPAGLIAPQWIGLGWTWAVVAILMLSAVGVTGFSLGKGWAGALIDPKTNTMSLSRLQIMLWTWVILSAFATLGLARVADSYKNPAGYECQAPAPNAKAVCSEPIGIEIPQLLWALMGISITSAVGSPLLKAIKARKTTGEDEASQQRAVKRGFDQHKAVTYRAVLDERKRADENLSEQVGETRPIGALVRKDAWQKAMFSDILTGEEVSTFGYVDIAKAQNLFFTLIAVVVYTVAIVSAMSAAQSVAHLFVFPDISSGLVAIIGISHGGYLIDKAVTHSTPAEGSSPEI
jgi:hypothetical protein